MRQLVRSGGVREGGPAPDRLRVEGALALGNVVYGGAHGILESPVVGVTTDEAQKRWVATRDALYLLRPGDERRSRFRGSRAARSSTSRWTG